MNMKNLIEKYNMKPHEENGSYCECHYPFQGEGRAPSGSSYFFTSPGEMTIFHRIDCDEYWCYNLGSTIEVWIINLDGKLEVRHLGVTENADPLIHFPKGVIFGSRNLDPEGEGTFFTCVTVPRFDYKGFELIEKDEVIRICPEAAEFWNH